MAAFEFLSLPSEIRIEIYHLAFGHGKVILEAKTEDDSGCLIPKDSKARSPAQRSSQFLRVSRAILDEARPILYANTTFHVLAGGFAGKLPLKLTDGHVFAPYVKNLIWQMDCDMLKHHYPEDVRLDTAQIAQWNSFELRCRAESWRDSFLGEWCDREAFVAGREQVINYARIFALAMRDPSCLELDMVEDRSQLGRGRVIVKLSRARANVKPDSRQTADHLPIFKGV
ncbi:hypothetical protein LTR84_013111 [Exophiala bonariae]|uniref:HNH nuclease domain-containing protein n=1 Tax=Exophiala bonariae TaxID=1690606 RepID=A0AAV9NIB4_9EURO|nr:hypothetical protein LTR84_013111 [Exophiala bonariae]